MLGAPLLLGDDGYTISRSVRLRNSASGYFSRTPGSAGNQKTFTFSFWAKRGGLTTATANDQVFFGVNYTGTNIFTIAIPQGASENLRILNYTAGALNLNLTTSQVFRDVSAWYHFVVAIDTTQATSSDRAKLYVNGQQVTAFSTATYPAQNADLRWNVSSQAHAIGRESTGSYFDGYLTEVNFIDGQALTPSAFGETDAITGVWKPKKYTGTYGTNGFFLNFSDNSSNTATTIGKDYSGNGNNWTPNNISVTAGATYDSMLDVPTLWADGGNGRGNYATLNPVQNPPSGAVSTAYSNANLTTTLDSSVARSTIGVSSGKWYAEFVITSATLSTDTRFAVEPSDGNTFSGNAGQGRAYSANGNKAFNGSSTAYGSTWTTNDVIGCALDLDNGKVWWSKNGTWQASGDPAAGTGEAYSGLSGTYLFTIVNGNSAVSKTFNANFGQRPFAYTPPTGFKALNTQNLPEPTIKKGNAYFNTVLYTGNGTGQTVSGVGFQPDFVWGKSRTQIRNHNLYDAVRGAGNMLLTNGTNAELTGGELSAFTSDGFTLGSNVYQMNPSGDSMVAWNWKEGATQGFDIVTYTGDGTSPRNISHSLGVAPAMVIVKSRGSVSSWIVKHKNLSSNNVLFLEGTNAQLSPSNGYVQDLNSSTTFGVVNGGGGVANVNTNGTAYVAYLFAEVAGFSKFGSYTGNGSADGPFVFTGFLPRWVMIKRTDSTSAWLVIDTTRQTYNVQGPYLMPNTSDAETTGTTVLDVVSNGFKSRSSSTLNTNGGTYIYAAFAESPFKLSLAR